MREIIFFFVVLLGILLFIRFVVRSIIRLPLHMTPRDSVRNPYRGLMEQVYGPERMAKIEKRKQERRSV